MVWLIDKNISQYYVFKLLVIMLESIHQNEKYFTRIQVRILVDPALPPQKILTIMFFFKDQKRGLTKLKVGMEKEFIGLILA